MRTALNGSADVRSFRAMDRWASSTLERIGTLISRGEVRPDGPPARGRPFRLGVFPVSANPLHWAHLMGGLAAMAKLRLDRVLYVVAGSDARKPDLAAEPLRHDIAERVLGVCTPLLQYSPVARGAARPGEENLFRIAASLGARPVHLFYIAGADHYRRSAPRSGCPDTIERLERGVRERAFGFEPERGQLTAVFLDRGDRGPAVESFLGIEWIDELPVHTSSTRIRRALAGIGPRGDLSALPYSAWRALGARGLPAGRRAA